MQRHAEEGARIIDRLGFLSDAVPGDPPPPRALRRHRLSGPAAGEDIPLGARIIHVADALDSMLTTRIYRAARPAAGGAAGAPTGRRHPVLPALRRRALERILPLDAALAERESSARRASPQLASQPARPQLAVLPESLYPFLAWPASRRSGRSRRSTPTRSPSFQAGIRKRYSNDQILDELRASARNGSAARRRCVSSRPTRRRAVHPQTVIEHFGSWNAAKREAGLVPRRFATREELVGLLRELGEDLGRVPTATRSRRAPRARCPRSRSTGTRSARSPRRCAKRASTSRSGRSGSSGRSSRESALARKLKRLPKFADWAAARRKDDGLLTEWQVYRMFDARTRRVVDLPVPDQGTPRRGGQIASAPTGTSATKAYACWVPASASSISYAIVAPRHVS